MDVPLHERSHALAAECDRLITIAEGMPAVAERRRAIAATWYGELLDLTQAASLETPDGERHLDVLVGQLRRAWMATAHEHADVTYRSPAADERKVLPSRTTIAYGYERSLENNPLEERLPAYRPVPAGWSARHLLFSSGMAALSGIMQALPAMLGPRGRQSSLLVAASYYETLDLVALGTHGSAARVVHDDDAFAAACDASPPDAAFVEPIIYDPWLRPFDVATAARVLAAASNEPVLVIDSTLVGPSLPISRILDTAASLPLVVQASSGLKLDQAGLELANVGIVSLYAPTLRLRAARRGRRAVAHGAPAQRHVADDRHRRAARHPVLSRRRDLLRVLLRGLRAQRRSRARGAGRRTLRNGRTSRARPARSSVVASAVRVLSSARRSCGELRRARTARDRRGRAERGLALERGGSFGFRGHRCEAVVLQGAARNGVFKVALGARSGPSIDGIVRLLREIAAFPSVAAASDAFGTAHVTR